jgi:hypothetical protein
MATQGKLYVIMVNVGEGWVSFDGLEYTAQEVETELRNLRYWVKGNIKFRKKCVYKGELETLSIHY